MTQFVSEMLVALGSNLPKPAGSPAANLAQALRELTTEGLVIRAVSRFFETPCFPPGAGPDYINAAAVFQTDLAPGDVLAKLHAVEQRMGRRRETRWGMRTLDLDLLASGDLVLPSAETHANWRDLSSEEQRLRAPDELILPHPRLAERAFVLVPLADVAPDWVHPVTGQTVREMLVALPAELLAEAQPL